jgi:hypothetical protein
MLRKLWTGALLTMLWAAAVDAAPEPARYLRLKRVQVIDKHGFEKPMPALSVLVPSDWTFDGEVRFAQQPGGSPADMVKIVFRAASPDGRTGVELFPEYSWTWADDPTMRQAIQNSNAMSAQLGGARTELMAPLSAREFLTRIAVPKLRPGARVVATEPIPEVEGPLKQQLQQAQGQAAQAGMQLRIKADHARARLQSTAGGQATEEWLTAIVYSSATPAPSMNPMTGQMAQTWTYQCAARSLYGLRAPAGSLDANEKLYRAVLSTVRIDPDWQRRVSQVQLNIQATQLKGARDRSRIASQASEDMRKTIREGYESRQRSHDRTSAEFSDALRGVQNYRNPATGEMVQLDNQYGHAWASGNGEYVLSDSPGFNPNSVLRGNWTELQPAHR